MLDTIYIITDLGPGDGGKGSVVHSLCHELDPAVVIKRGGAQGSHGVCTSQGEKFNFSQWGCGTFEGIPTYCSPHMIVSPAGLENESNALKYHGIYDPFSMISFHPDCICSTPYHMIASQLEELKLGDHPRGTVGTGVGRAYRMFEVYTGIMSIFTSDLKDKKRISTKIKRQMDYYREYYKDMSRDNGIPEDKKYIDENLDLLYDDGLFDYTISLFESIGDKIKLSDWDAILKQSGVGIVECSHGVLTDSIYGLTPHVSAIRTLPYYTEEMLQFAGYSNQIVNYGVHRAYEIRHGAGPIPSYDPDFTTQMLPGSHKEDNRWQGSVRAGPLDLNFLKYALSVCKKTKFDGLCLTWFDQILATSDKWKIAVRTTLKDRPDLPTNLPISYINHEIPKGIDSQDLINFVDKIVSEYVGVPLVMLSVGPTEKDKIMKLGGYHHA